MKPHAGQGNCPQGHTLLKAPLPSRMGRPWESTLMAKSPAPRRRLAERSCQDAAAAVAATASASDPAAGSGRMGWAAGRPASSVPAWPLPPNSGAAACQLSTAVPTCAAARRLAARRLRYTTSAVSTATAVPSGAAYAALPVDFSVEQSGKCAQVLAPNSSKAVRDGCGTGGTPVCCPAAAAGGGALSAAPCPGGGGEDKLKGVQGPVCLAYLTPRPAAVGASHSPALPG